jgi:hypothetical protein
MFDNLREQADSGASFGEEEALGASQGLDEPAVPGSNRRLFLGMTAPQRLIIAVLVLVAVCVLGTMCLLVTGRIGVF